VIESARQSVATGKLAGVHVLVVEDEYFIAEELRLLLARQGAEVLGPVSDRAQASAILVGTVVDCAVLDIDLNGRAVFPLIEELKLRNVPWLYASGYSADLVPDSLRGRAHIEKPIVPDALVAAVLDITRLRAK